MKAKLTLYADHSRNKISNLLFGHFMEHAGDIIYDGIYAPGSELSDEKGYREDVCAAIMASGASTLRYPGGNFVSNYHWEDGIGPKESRPKVFDYAWLTDDDNRMGTVEFIELCRKVGAEPYICVNMGSGTAEEAMHWVEFCNGTGESKYVQMRRNLGYDEPFGVKYWGLGNEMYGDWQFAACSAEVYAQKAKDFAKAMKWVDPTISLVAAGYDIDSDWNRIVAGKLDKLIDHIAIHHYSIGYGVFQYDDYKQCMYIPEYLTKLTDVCRSSIVAGTNDSLTHIKVAWDEWNTYGWNMPWQEDEATYNLKNAIHTALIMHGFIKNSDMVEIASYSPFVNMCGAVRTTDEGMLKRSQCYVFEMLSEAFKKCSGYLNTSLECEAYSLPEVIDFSNRLPEPQFALNVSAVRRTVQTPYIDAIAAVDDDRKMLAVSIINKHETEDIELNIGMYGVEADWDGMEATVLYADDMKAFNTVENPDNVVPVREKITATDGVITVKKHSLTVVTLPLK